MNTESFKLQELLEAVITYHTGLVGFAVGFSTAGLSIAVCGLQE